MSSTSHFWNGWMSSCSCYQDVSFENPEMTSRIQPGSFVWSESCKGKNPSSEDPVDVEWPDAAGRLDAILWLTWLDT